MLFKVLHAHYWENSPYFINNLNNLASFVIVQFFIFDFIIALLLFGIINNNVRLR